MAGDFGARIDELIESVGEGELEGSVVVDQVYARAQHERLDYKHPRGGQAKYLGGPLLEQHHAYMQRLANNVLRGSLADAMIECMEDLSKQVFEKAPREFWDLRESANPRVFNQGEPIYDRAPIVHRLSKGELRVKDQLRRRGLGGGAPA